MALIMPPAMATQVGPAYPQLPATVNATTTGWCTSACAPGSGCDNTS